MSAVGIDELTVFVVDDDSDVREGLRALVESAGFRCQIYGSPKEFLGQARFVGLNCLILDVRLPEMSGLEVQAELARGSRSISTIIITGHGDIPMTVRAMKAGAVAFLTKPVRAQDLLDAIYAAIETERARLNTESRHLELRARYESLTTREREILPLITAGFLNKQIAAEVGLSEITVKVHRHKLMAKLNANRLPDLVRIADTLGVRHQP
jgi:FixJ family two-component response regulator